MKKMLPLILCITAICGCNNAKPAPEPVIENSVVEPVVEPVFEPIAEPIVEQIVEPVADTASQAEIDAVKTLIKKSHEAVCNDDAKAFAECFVQNEKLKSLIDSIFNGMKKQYELEEAIVARFGEEGLDLFYDPAENPDKPEGTFMHASFMCPPKDEPWWDDSDVEIEIDGDTGTFYNPWQNTYSSLRKENAQWLIDFSEIPDEAMPMVEQMQAGMLKGITQCLELVKQENTKVYDLNAELGKALFGDMSDQNEDQ